MDHLERFFERVALFVVDLIGFFSGDAFSRDEFLHVKRLDRFFVSDFSIQAGLSEGGFIALVMSMLPVANEIDHDVVTKPLAISHCELGHVDHGFRMITIHMKDRNLDHLCDIGAIERRACLCGGRRVADLVVDDDVDRAAGAIAGKLRKVQCLCNHTLARKGCVAVDDDGNDRFAIRITCTNLLRLRAPFNDRINGLEMRRIRSQSEMDAFPRRDAPIAGEALVIFHIARAEGCGDIRRIFELREDRLVALPKNIRENIQSTTMGHADDDLAYSKGGCIFHYMVEQRNQGFPALE